MGDGLKPWWCHLFTRISDRKVCSPLCLREGEFHFCILLTDWKRNTNKIQNGPNDWLFFLSADKLICSSSHVGPVIAPMELVVDQQLPPCVPLQMSVRQCRRRPSPNGWTLTWAGWPVASATCTRTYAMAACWSASWRSSQGNSWSVWKHRITRSHTHTQPDLSVTHSHTLQGREKSCASLLLSACSTSPLPRAHIKMQWKGFTKHNIATHCGNRTQREEMTTSHPRVAVLHIYLKGTCSYRNTHAPQGLLLCQTDCTTTLYL